MYIFIIQESPRLLQCPSKLERTLNRILKICQVVDEEVDIQGSILDVPHTFVQDNTKLLFYFKRIRMCQSISQTVLGH